MAAEIQVALLLSEAEPRAGTSAARFRTARRAWCARGSSSAMWKQWMIVLPWPRLSRTASG